MHPLFILSVADFILAILWLVGGVVWLSPDANGWATPESETHTGMCYVLAIATTVRKTLLVSLIIRLHLSSDGRDCHVSTDGSVCTECVATATRVLPKQREAPPGTGWIIIRGSAPR